MMWCCSLPLLPAGVRKQSCIMRRCVRMTSSGSGGGCSSTTAGSSTSSSRGPGSDRGDAEPSPVVRKPDPEQALFWAAVSGCMALTGQANGGSDDDSAATHGHPGRGSRDSNSSSPPSPDRSVADSELYGSHYSLPSASPWWGGSLRGDGLTNAESFCGKLASVLVRSPLAFTLFSNGHNVVPQRPSSMWPGDQHPSLLITPRWLAQAHDTSLAAQPIALRALQRAGVGDTQSPSNLALSLENPAIQSHLMTSLAAAAGLPATEFARARLGPAGESFGAPAVRSGLSSVDLSSMSVEPRVVGSTGTSSSQHRRPSASTLGLNGTAAGYTQNALPTLLSLVAQSEMLASDGCHFTHPMSVTPRVVDGHES